VEPHWTPALYCDERVAWLGQVSGWMSDTLRVEAGSYRGKPHHFQLVGPEAHPWRMPELVEWPMAWRINRVFFPWLAFVALAGGILLASRNLREGRGDRRGALLVGSLAFLGYELAWVFQAHHTFGVEELDDFLEYSGALLLTEGITTAVMYLALEPFVRRRWPRSLVSWSRLVAGRLRDPLVGRHILFGCAAGAIILLVTVLQYRAPTLLGWPPGEPPSVDWNVLLGARWVIGELALAIRDAVVMPMTALFLIVLFPSLLRSRWAGMVMFAVVVCLPDPGWLEAPVIQLPFTLAKAALFALLLVRCGLVGGGAAILVGPELLNHPITLDFSTWYSGSTILALVAAVALTFYGFAVSLGGSAPQATR